MSILSHLFAFNADKIGKGLENIAANAQRDIEAVFKRISAIERTLNDLPERIAAYEKIYLKSVLQEIDPESVAAELDEAEALLAAFMEEAKKIVEAKERENQKVAYMAEMEDAPAGWATTGDLAKKHNLSTSRVSFILREACIEKKLLARTIVTRTLSKKWHYDEAKADKLIAKFEAEEAKRRNENE